ncbi:Swt1 family HEPN domain-containing protein [Actinosynnema sp. CA-248983]
MNALEKTLATLIDQHLTQHTGASWWADRVSRDYESIQSSAELALSLRLLTDSRYIDLNIRDQKFKELTKELIDARNVWAHANDLRTRAHGRETLDKASRLLRLLGRNTAAEAMSMRYELLGNNAALICHAFDPDLQPSLVPEPAKLTLNVRLHGLTSEWQSNVSTAVHLDDARITRADDTVAVIDKRALMAFSMDDGTVPEWSPISTIGNFCPAALEWQGYFVIMEDDPHDCTRTLTFRSPHHGQPVFTVELPWAETGIHREPSSWCVETQEFDLAGNRSTEPDDHWLLTVDRHGVLNSLLDRFSHITFAPPSVDQNASYSLIGIRKHRVAITSSKPDETWVLDLEDHDRQWTGGDRNTLILSDDGYFLLQDGLVHRINSDGDLRWALPTRCTKLLGVYGETLLAGTERGSLLAFNIDDPDNSWHQPDNGNEKVRFTAGDGLIASWDNADCYVHNWKDGTFAAAIKCTGGSIADAQILSDTRLAVLFKPGVLAVFSLDDDADEDLEVTA